MDTRRLSLAELREVVRDPEELKKGAEVFDHGGLLNLARHGDKIFSEAKGSGASPYRVTVTVGPTAAEVKARCSCMAARSRPYCKHGAALVVAWARAPQSFVVSEAPPAGATGEAKKKSVKVGKTEAKDLMGRGVEQVGTLVRELALSGVASIGAERPAQVRALGETLRENRLRRLSARTLELADMLDAIPAKGAAFSPLAYTDLVADLLLTARKLEKHLAGEAIEDRHVEELIGKTWRKTDRKPISGLDLVEYAFVVRTTADDFVIRESRFLDLGSGAHYSEKQILPVFLAKRSDPKPSYAGMRLGVRAAGVYPSFSPLRLDLEEMDAPDGLLPRHLEAVLSHALPDAASALKAFQEHRRDVFAPDRFPVFLRAPRVVSRDSRLTVVDDTGAALYMPRGTSLVDALQGVRLVALLGDLDLDGVLPLLRPLAAVTESPSGLALRTFPEDAEGPRTAAGDWAAEARAAGVSAGALSLGEVREDLAAAFVNGLGGLIPRVTEPLAARLSDLGLEKPAALLRQIVGQPDPAERLDDFVRLYQVLGLGVVRLAGTVNAGAAPLVPVPSAPSVFVVDPGPAVEPHEVARRRALGTMGPLEAAVHRDRYFGAISPDAVQAIRPYWCDGACAPYVARSVAALGADVARAIAEEALDIAPPLNILTIKYGLAAALTAVRVLEALAAGPSLDMLERLAGAAFHNRRITPMVMPSDYINPVCALQSAARESLAALAQRGVVSFTPPDASALRVSTEVLHHAPRMETRANAAGELRQRRDRGALSALRRAWQHDPTDVVREAAAMALASLGDVGVVESFIDALVAREARPERAKAAAYALGALGDIRGLVAICEALAEGWKSGVTIDALSCAGLASVPAILSTVAARPELGNRRGFVAVLERLPEDAVQDDLLAALAALPQDGFTEKASAFLKLAAAHKTARAAVGAAILSRALPDDRAGKALRKAAEAAGQ